MGRIKKNRELRKLSSLMSDMKHATAVKQATDPQHLEAKAKQEEANRVHDAKVVREGLSKASKEELALAAVEKARD